MRSVGEGPLASRFRRQIVMAMLAVYTGFVLVITLSPQMPGSGLTRRLVHRVIASLRAREILDFVDFLFLEFIGNILMFIPLGVFIALLISRRYWWVLLIAGTGFSGFIELGQLLFLPDRFPEVRDLVSNSTGFIIGAILAVVLRMAVAHRDDLVRRDRAYAG